MVPPARWGARGSLKGERASESSARGAADRPRGVAAPRPSERPCALRPAEPHIPRAPSALPRPRRPLRGSAAAARLPQRAVERAGTGRGARGRGRVRGRRHRLRECPGRPTRLTKRREREPGKGERQGERWGRGRGGRPLRGVGWTSPASHPQDRNPRHRRRRSWTYAARHSRPLAVRRRCQPLSEARRPAQARYPRRRK